MDIINGIPVPYDLPISKLKSNMQSFVLACEALSANPSKEVYNILKEYINDKDKYRRLYILKTIFRNPHANELTDYLENAISSNDILFASNGIRIAREYNIAVSEKVLKDAIIKNFDELEFELHSLGLLKTNDENYILLKSLFEKSASGMKQDIIAEILCNKYLQKFPYEIFDLLSQAKFGKTRKIAVEIGIDNSFDLSRFENDTDGHVKKALNKLF